MTDFFFHTALGGAMFVAFMLLSIVTYFWAVNRTFTLRKRRVKNRRGQDKT